MVITNLLLSCLLRVAVNVYVLEHINFFVCSIIGLKADMMSAKKKTLSIALVVNVTLNVSPSMLQNSWMQPTPLLVLRCETHDHCS